MCDGYDLGKRVCFGHQLASILFVVLMLGGCDVARDSGIEYTASIKEIGPDPTHKAPDDFNVWELEDINAGEVAQFQLPPQTIGGAIQHKTVSEIWFITAGNGRVWIDGIGEKEIRPGTYFIIPPETGFQVRNDSTEALSVLGLTMPQFDPSEVVPIIGPWTATSNQ
jgi:mannose-6-phosphate isomerase-like protein (cupin superfamily)